MSAEGNGLYTDCLTVTLGNRGRVSANNPRGQTRGGWLRFLAAVAVADEDSAARPSPHGKASCRWGVRAPRGESDKRAGIRKYPDGIRDTAGRCSQGIDGKL